MYKFEARDMCEIFSIITQNFFNKLDCTVYAFRIGRRWCDACTFATAQQSLLTRHQQQVDATLYIYRQPIHLHTLNWYSGASQVFCLYINMCFVQCSSSGVSFVVETETVCLFVRRLMNFFSVLSAFSLPSSHLRLFACDIYITRVTNKICR